MNKKEEVSNGLLTLVDMIIIFIINYNEGSGNTDRGRRRRKRIIQCINCSRYNIVIAKTAATYITTTTATHCG